YPDGVPLPAPLPWPALRVDEENTLLLREKFSLTFDRPVLVMCPGAEFGPAKKWPGEHYGRLAAASIREGRQVWLLGSANDAPAAAEIRAQLDAQANAHCIDFSGRTSLAEAIDLLG